MRDPDGEFLGTLEVTQDVAPGEVLEPTAPFEPAPLLDALRAKGHEVHVDRDGDAFRVLVRRRS